MSEDNEAIVIALDAGAQWVEFAFPSDPPTRMILATAAVDSALAALAMARTGMVPAVPATWKEEQTVKHCYRDPPWSIETDRLAGDVVLHLRDERFGWLHYVIGKANALELAAALANIAVLPPPPMRGVA